jgi:hypothetical protein
VKLRQLDDDDVWSILFEFLVTGPLEGITADHAKANVVMVAMR